jgi:putative restriction endonuclease
MTSFLEPNDTMEFEFWLAKLTDLNPAKGDAPHKPLLLLSLLDLAERDGSLPSPLWLTPELDFTFKVFEKVVAHRRSRRLDIRMPFHHLKTQGFWKAFTEQGLASPHRSVTRHVIPEPEFAAACADPTFRKAARRILIAKHFQPAERNALYNLVGMEIPSDDQIANDASYELPHDAEIAGRNGRFRLDIVPAYNYTCALTGYRITTISGGSIVDAAHIHEFSDSRNNDPRNGMALCKNAHWMFDTGLWSVDTEYRVIVANDAYSEASPNQTPLSNFSGRRLLLPSDQAIWPAPKHLAWHRRRHRFEAAS